MDIREKRAAEKFTVGFDFAPDLASGEHFHSANVVCSTGLTATGLPIIAGDNNTQITQFIEGGTAGNYYSVTITGTTDAGNIFQKVFVIRVVADVLPSTAGVYALVRLDEAKDYIGKTTDEDSAIIERIIDNVSREFNTYTDRTLVAFSHTNVYFDGNGKQIMYLPNWPVISVGANTAVYEDGTLLVEGSNNDFILYPETGEMYRVNNVWYYGPRTIKATYIAGYVCTTANSTLPEDLRMAALKQIAYEFSHYQRKDWGVESITYPDGSRSTTQVGLLKDVQLVLDFYRRFKS